MGLVAAFDQHIGVQFSSFDCTMIVVITMCLPLNYSGCSKDANIHISFDSVVPSCTYLNLKLAEFVKKQMLNQNISA